MFNLSCMLWIGALINIVLIQSAFAGYERTFSSCSDFKLANGRMRIKPKGRLAKFLCNRGYVLAGEKYSYCIKGKFDVPPPVCVKPTCAKIKQLANGIILPSYNGGVMNFYCKPGFTMRGSNISYCDGLRWNRNLPACISTHTPIPMSCDFETEDLCGWSHDLNHDFDWRREKFQTPSGHIGTGPRHDHTKGANQDGYYMYTESSSRLEYDIARFISPLYPRPTGTMCFTFWYHMYGRDMGTLHVYLQEAGNPQEAKIVWTEEGNQGNVWHRASVELEVIQDDFQIIFEGVRGKSYVSDIAIDDVSLSESCPDYDEFTNTSSTTELSTDEDSDIYFGSCLNRCSENNTEMIMSDAGSCECNELCYERNTCCPDYTAVCLIAELEQSTLDDLELSTTIATTEFEDTTEVITTSSTLTETDFIKESIIISNTTPVPSTHAPNTTTETIKITTNSTTIFIKPININNQTKNTQMTTTPFSVPVTNVTIKPRVTTTNRPKTTFTKPTPKPNKNKNNNNINKITTNAPNTTLAVTKIPTTSTSTTKATVATVTMATTKLPKQTEAPTSVPVKIDKSLEVETDYETPDEPKVENKAKMVKEENLDNSSNISVVIFCASFAVVVAGIIGIVIFVKYSARCSRFRFRNARNSDSMSDVRFLASDEVLDFTWKTSSDM